MLGVNPTDGWSRGIADQGPVEGGKADPSLLHAHRRSERALIDGVWPLCEETSWCLPAHHLFARRSESPLPGPAEPYVDLFAAETAGLLAYTDLLTGDLIEEIAPVARRRLREEVKARVLGSFIAALDGRPLNRVRWLPGAW